MHLQRHFGNLFTSNFVFSRFLTTVEIAIMENHTAKHMTEARFYPSVHVSSKRRVLRPLTLLLMKQIDRHAAWKQHIQAERPR